MAILAVLRELGGRMKAKVLLHLWLCLFIDFCRFACSFFVSSSVSTALSLATGVSIWLLFADVGLSVATIGSAVLRLPMPFPFAAIAWCRAYPRECLVAIASVVAGRVVSTKPGEQGVRVEETTEDAADSAAAGTSEGSAADGDGAAGSSERRPRQRRKRRGDEYDGQEVLGYDISNAPNHGVVQPTRVVYAAHSPNQVET